MPAYVVNGTADTFLFDRSPENDAVRAWARARGYLVNDNGRIPAAIREAYENQQD
ncbi:histone-like nucleoid-structuring protein Lsr2 [Streptomyces sp. NPDC091271]|uniref:Lsr2 family DNA-binding protein n=1 Tax=Streptomyces sp. NPDC091271 TaxID=3365980 RepID=UPI0038153CBD